MNTDMANYKTMTNYNYQGPLNGGYAIQDKNITAELRDFCMSTYEWDEFFAADGVTDHREKFIEIFGRWIRSSELNTIDGLDAFSHVTQTNGTSEAFSMFMQRHRDKNFKFFKGDFMMHKVACNNMNVKWEWIYNYSQVRKGDAVIISCPFSDTGRAKEDMHELLEWCTINNVPVLIDMAYLNSNWKKSGKFTFLGNQSSYSYWTAGGQTSVSGTIKVDYDFNFENNGWNWDTKLITAYGLNSIGGSKFIKKTDDRIEVNSLLGKKFTNNLIGNWSYSSFLNFKTQWTKGFRYSNT